MFSLYLWSFISFSAFITPVLKSWSSRLLRCISLTVLSGDFYCSFNWESFPSFFILLISLWHYGLWSISYLLWPSRDFFFFEEDVFLCRLCTPNNFFAMSVFSMDGSHVFLLCVLSVILLIRDVAGVVMTRAFSGFLVWSPFCSVVVTALSGTGSVSFLLGVRLPDLILSSGA